MNCTGKLRAKVRRDRYFFSTEFNNCSLVCGRGISIEETENKKARRRIEPSYTFLKFYDQVKSSNASSF